MAGLACEMALVTTAKDGSWGTPTRKGQEEEGDRCRKLRRGGESSTGAEDSTGHGGPCMGHQVGKHCRGPNASDNKEQMLFWGQTLL